MKQNKIFSTGHYNTKQTKCHFTTPATVPLVLQPHWETEGPRPASLRSDKQFPERRNHNRTNAPSYTHELDKARQIPELLSHAGTVCVIHCVKIATS